MGMGQTDDRNIMNSEETGNVRINQPNRVYRIALCGGPCGGKSTVQTILSDCFQNMGWKVYQVPESATILLGGGVQFSQLDAEQASDFRMNLLRTMLTLEDTYMTLALGNAKRGQKCIVLCDRGAMDPSAYIDRKSWNRVLDRLGLKELELRDGRYDYVFHLVTAANGAEKFYSSLENATRSEGLELACQLDRQVMNAWLGHPYFEVIDNSTGFQEKIQRVIDRVYKRLGIRDTRGSESVKHKFLLESFPTDEEFQGHFEDFEVRHDYLSTTDETQIRIRRRGRNGIYTYTATVRMKEIEGQRVELRRNLSGREYDILMLQRDPSHQPVIKRRRCFIYENQYYQLDEYQSPNPGLVLMEAYLDRHVLEGRNIATILPSFIKTTKEVTNDSQYSMFNISMLASQQL